MTPADPIERAARRIEAETGLLFPGPRRRDLVAACERMTLEAGFGSARALADWLAEGPWEQCKTDLCARHLTIGETYFFREPRGLELLCDYARARLQADPQAGLRLWSAGCASGEEPYSMALALRAALPQLDPERVSILATDLNPASLDRARAAVYREWSFRRTASAERAAWFTGAGPGHYRLRPEVRRQVSFAQLNLAQEAYPPETGAMDLIFCRNVLMYFSRSRMREVIVRMRACLVEGGWLVVNPSEASAELFAGFSAHYHPDAVFYCKDSRAGSRTAPAASSPQPVPAACVRPPPRLGPSARPAPAAPAAADAAGLQRQAQELGARGDLAGAARVLARALQRWPLAPELHLAAAETALAREDCAGALRHLQGHLYLQPDSILGHYLCAVARLAAGSGAAARRELAVCTGLLDGVADDAAVPGAPGWLAGSLRAGVRTISERAR